MSHRPDVLLGFDFGRIRIGVAIGQSVTGSAQPLETVTCDDYKPDWTAIARLIRTWRPNRLVVGLPLKMDGTEQEMTEAARRFGRQLEGRYAVPVHLADERLTSREARSLLREAGKPYTDTDPLAAKLILESWLAEHAAS